jgi:hypothetical protein
VDRPPEQELDKPDETPATEPSDDAPKA